MIPHVVGIWLNVLITHGLLVDYFGPLFTHAPFLFSLFLVFLIVLSHAWAGVDTKIIFLAVAFLIIMLVAGLIGLNQSVSLWSTSLYAKSILYSLIVGGCIRSSRDLRVLARYAIAGITLGAAYTIYQHLTGSYTIKNIYVQRAAGLRGDPNDTAMILMVGIPLAFHQFSSTSRVAEKAFYLMIFLTITIGIILTGSRGGFVTFLGIISLIFFRKPSASGCFGVIAVGSILALFANDAFWARMGTLISGHEEHGSSLSQRTELLKGAFSIFLDNPLFGVGPGNFGRGLVARGISRGEGSSAVLSEDLSVNFGVAHNMHLEVLAETGICGALLFWSICFLSLAGMSRYDRVLRSSSSDFSLAFAFFAALLSMLFFGLFLSQGKNTVLWFLLGVGFAMGRLSTLAGASRGITEKASRFGTRVQDFAKTLHTGTSTG